MCVFFSDAIRRPPALRRARNFGARLVTAGLVIGIPWLRIRFGASRLTASISQHVLFCRVIPFMLFLLVSL